MQSWKDSCKALMKAKIIWIRYERDLDENDNLMLNKKDRRYRVRH